MSKQNDDGSAVYPGKNVRPFIIQISENARKLTDSFREEQADIPWREKKSSEEANARYNEMLYYGLTEASDE